MFITRTDVYRWCAVHTDCMPIAFRRPMLPVTGGVRGLTVCFVTTSVTEVTDFVTLVTEVVTDVAVPVINPAVIVSSEDWSEISGRKVGQGSAGNQERRECRKTGNEGSAGNREQGSAGTQSGAMKYQWCLERRQPADWGNRTDTEGTGRGGLGRPDGHRGDRTGRTGETGRGGAAGIAGNIGASTTEHAGGTGTGNASSGNASCRHPSLSGN